MGASALLFASSTPLSGVGDVLRFARPALPPPEEWLPYLQEAYEAQYFSNFGPVHQRFAAALTERFGSEDRIALPVASCTAGITAVLLALGVRGKVAMPSFTFSSPAHAVLAAGCTPVFCDIDSETWELSPSCLESLLAGEDIKAVLHVRVFGLCRDLSAIEQVCRRFDKPLIVDAAAALGGNTLSGPQIGHGGRFEIFSMHATKTFGIGEGGVVFGSVADIDKLHSVINFGQANQEIVTHGLNGKMCEVHAAIGLAVMDDIELRIATRSAAASVYDDHIQRLGVCRLPSDIGLPGWSAYPVEFRSAEALGRVKAAVACTVETRRYYFPNLHKSTAFRQLADLPVTDALEARILCLPLYSNMTADESNRVGRAVFAALSSEGAEE